MFCAMDLFLEPTESPLCLQVVRKKSKIFSVNDPNFDGILQCPLHLLWPSIPKLLDYLSFYLCPIRRPIFFPPKFATSWSLTESYFIIPKSNYSLYNLHPLISKICSENFFIILKISKISKFYKLVT